MSVGTIVCAITMAAVLALTGASREAASRQLAEGPTLAGAQVVWSEYSDGESVIRRWRPGLGTDEVFRSASATVRNVVGTERLLAFQRVYPGCPPSPGVACPTVTDLAVGPVGGPFRPFTNAWNCFLVADEAGLDIDEWGIATRILYDVVDCALGRISTLLRTSAGPPVGDGGVAFLRDVSMKAACCGPLRLAGQYVAWTENSNERVVVRGLAARTRLSVRVGDGVHVRPLAFDVQADGTLAVLSRGRIFAVSHVGAKQRTIARGVPEGHVRIAGGQVAFARQSAIAIASLGGDLRVVARFRSPARLRRAFDFDGRRLTFASDTVDQSWIDCPPPGSERPCVRRESGTTTIWLAQLPTLRPVRIASFAFSGIPPPGG